MMITAFAVASCSDDLEQESQEVDFCVRSVWQDGLSGGRTSRALSTTDILADGTSDINIDFADYPATISVSCRKGATEVLPLTLTKSISLCADHPDYWNYTPSFLFRDQNIKREDYKFYATATIDGGDELKGEADQSNIDGTHLKLTLHHTKSLLRFAFKVDPRYDKVRYIRVTAINLNGNDCELVDKVLTTDGQLIAYAYIDPAEVTTSYENTIQCTYNIYDKDPSAGSGQVATDAHLTRKGVKAQNTFKLGSLKKADSVTPITVIEAGYYYDLKVTLNPDYLYVLAEHDNKHITIN